MTDVTGVAAVEEIRAEVLRALEMAATEEQLEDLRVAYLGRRGKLTQILRSLGSITPEVRRETGAAANELKEVFEEKLAARRKVLADKKLAALSGQEKIDVTLPGRPYLRGGLHPTTRIIREILDTFVSMGFAVAEGPEIEWDRYNFESLNIPKDHPARDIWDTLWVDYTDDSGYRPMLLRTHTSPMQARIMETVDPPVRVVVPGKCYRYEATDATHEWHFYQIEGLAVDEGITFGNLKGTLYEFAQRMFGEERKIRFRCDYFPFVEPGVDMSIDCFQCDGDGCRICSHTGWIEIMGAGMVHPNVLSSAGYDSSVYTGFAFGMGPERIAMLKYGIDDIRNFYSNDLRFLREVGD